MQATAKKRVCSEVCHGFLLIIILCPNRWLPRRWGRSKERARFSFCLPRAAGVANQMALEFFRKNTAVSSGSQKRVDEGASARVEASKQHEAQKR